MFSLFLGTHSKLIGLGGIDRSVRLLADALATSDRKKVERLTCTCGSPGTGCRYWGEVTRRIPAHDVSNRRAQYALALRTFADVFGDGIWPVDSSKHVEPLKDLRELKDVDLRVVHLIKDVRSLTASRVADRRSKGTRRPSAVLALESFWRWRRENGKIDDCLASGGMAAKRVGYEEVCLAPEIIMRKVASFVGIPEEPGSLDFEHSNSHLIVGNRMREQKEKQKLRYDHRWFARHDWLPAALLLPQVLRYNARAVYSNDCAAMWSR